MGMVVGNWDKLPPETKGRFQKVAFPKGIPYSRETGFGTVEMGRIFRMNQEFQLQSNALVDPSGLEPLTSTLQMWRSTARSEREMNASSHSFQPSAEAESPEGLLQEPKGLPAELKNFGGPERTRTAYLHIANVAFYQMNYGPLTRNDLIVSLSTLTCLYARLL